MKTKWMRVAVAALAVSALLAIEAIDAQMRTRLLGPYVPGVTGDSVAGGRQIIFPRIEIGGARQVTFFLRDSAFLPYVDSLSAATIQFSNNDTSWTDSVVVNDATAVATSAHGAAAVLGDFTSVSIKGSAVGGWKTAIVIPPLGTVPGAVLVPRFARLYVVPNSRWWNPSVSGTASMKGLRLRVAVSSDGGDFRVPTP